MCSKDNGNDCCSKKRGCVSNMPTKWQLSVKVPDYKPCQLCVQVKDSAVEVKGEKSVECTDASDNSSRTISEAFSEKYCMPSDVDPKTVNWEFTKDCKLLVTACKKPIQPCGNSCSKPC
uniref:SHSP domain-containing protein n=1 Tax=Strigamia maritima TaxID=126957 RepID=T1J3M4_STRMM